MESSNRALLLTRITDPNDAASCDIIDSDGDGVLDEQQIIDETEPNNPYDYIMSSITETQGGDYLIADCDGNGVTNGYELAGHDGGPLTENDNTDRKTLVILHQKVLQLLFQVII